MQILSYVAHSVTPHNWGAWEILGCQVSKKDTQNYPKNKFKGVTSLNLVNVCLWYFGHS